MMGQIKTQNVMSCLEKKHRRMILCWILKGNLSRTANMQK